MTATTTRATRHGRSGRVISALRFALLLVGALAALVPFYYMVIGALQRKRDTSLLGLLPLPQNLTFDNFVEITNR